MNQELRLIAERQNKVMRVYYATYLVLAVANLAAGLVVSPRAWSLPAWLPHAGSFGLVLATGTLGVLVFGVFVPLLLILLRDPRRARPMRPRRARAWLVGGLQVEPVPTGETVEPGPGAQGLLALRKPLPVDLDQVSLVQAAFSLRYFVAYVVVWAAAPSVGMLATVARMFGAGRPVVIAVATVAVLILAFLPPDGRRLQRGLLLLDDGPPCGSG